MTFHIPPHRPKTPGAQAFLTDAPKKLLIANEWHDAAGGGTFATHDPASGACLHRSPKAPLRMRAAPSQRLARPCQTRPGVT